jgi:type I restriction enzyme S subunit
MALALFRSWFVDFDPVRAKSEGHNTGLSNGLATLFPKGFAEDGLPMGWSTGPFSDLFDISGGNTPRTENTAFWGGRHQWATPKDLSGLFTPILLQTGRQLTDVGLAQASSGLLPPGSLLLSTRAPIGYMAFIARPTAINQGFAGIVRKQTTPAYAWGWCRINMDVIAGNAGGSTFPEISKAVLRQLPMLAPPQAVLDAFGSIVDPLIDRIVAAAKQSETLNELRDTLLPKLISGELRIADVGKQIVAA